MKIVTCLLALLLLASQVDAAEVKVVAESAYQWTGIAISQENRMFVCYPTWSNYPAYKVAEIKNGEARPYPNAERAASFSCVQSVYADKDDYLWILDTGKPRGQKAEAGTAKLYKVDLKQNRIVWQYGFPASVDLATSYLNDVRIDTKQGYAYLTDSTQGGLIVVNLRAQVPYARRALEGIKQVKADLPGIDFVSTGFDKHQTHSDGLELSPDGKTLYFAALTGHTLYAVPTSKLRAATGQQQTAAKAIKIVNKQSVPADGLWWAEGKLYMGDLANEGIYVFDLQTKKGHGIKLDRAIHWADSFAQDKQGNIYFTTSQINYRKNPNEPYRIDQLKL